METENKQDNAVEGNKKLYLTITHLKKLRKNMKEQLPNNLSEDHGTSGSHPWLD